MTYDPERAAVIRLRLTIGQLLDDSAGLSFLQRAQFRMELLNILDAADHRHAASDDTTAKLGGLHERIRRVAVTPKR